MEAAVAEDATVAMDASDVDADAAAAEADDEALVA